MADFYSQLDEKIQDFIRRQQIFFVATAPAEGRINLSPKGMETFSIVSNTQVLYMDLTGSGNETAAHIMEDPRITVMFCSFDTQPLILRLYGKASVILPSDGRWDEVRSSFEIIPGVRQIFQIDIDSVQTSCGYAVPLMDFKEHRQTLRKWAEKKGDEGIHQYQLSKNCKSIDGKTIPLTYEYHSNSS